MKRTTENKALVIGISDYPGEISNLPAVTSDVREVAKILSSKNGRFDKSSVEILVNNQAKRSKVLSALRKTFQASSTATVFVYIAGHGCVVNGEYFFITHDALGDDLQKTAIPLNDLKKLFESTASKQAFLWLDFCHSGGIITRDFLDNIQDERSLVKRSLEVVHGEGKVIIAACTESQFAHEDQKHGLFTHALLRGLRGEAESHGEVTVASLYDFIDRNISHPDQKPMFFGKMSGRIILMHYDSRTKSDSSKKIEKKKNTKPPSKLIKNSDNWVLLDEKFFKAKKVIRNPDKTLSIIIRSTNAELDASVQSLSPQQSWGRNEVSFAYQNDAATVRVDSVSSESDGTAQLWNLALTPVDNQSHNVMQEFSYNDGTQTYSPDDIAMLRTRRILLNEVFAARGQFGIPSLIENDQDGLTCPIQDIYVSHGNQKSTWPKLARLKAIALLKSTSSVDHILELSIQPIGKKKVRIVFRGLRPVRFHNEPPHEFSIKGDCILV